MDNFFDAIEQVSSLVQDGYTFVAMDTEFSGTVYFPPEVTSDFEYQIVRANVSRLKLIQIGITLSRADGTLPAAKTACVFQFNLFFDLQKEHYA